MTLTEFLLARIAEDEAVARQTNPHLSDEIDDWDAQTDAEARWDRQPHGQRCAWKLGEGMADKCKCGYPARVLAECEAKRRIADMHTSDATWDGGEECAQCSFHEAYEGFNDVSETFPCTTLRLLALPYADHPSFDPAWAVE